MDKAQLRNRTLCNLNVKTITGKISYGLSLWEGFFIQKIKQNLTK